MALQSEREWTLSAMAACPVSAQDRHSPKAAASTLYGPSSQGLVLVEIKPLGEIENQGSCGVEDLIDKGTEAVDRLGCWLAVYIYIYISMCNSAGSLRILGAFFFCKNFRDIYELFLDLKAHHIVS